MGEAEGATEDAGQLCHAAFARAQGERRWQAQPQGQGARRSAPLAASQPDPLRGGPGGALPALLRRRDGCGAGGGADLRPHRDPRDRPGRDAGGAARRRLPLLRRALQGPNLRAFVLYLRFGQVIPFERLARLLRDLFGLEISEGALANLLEDSAPAFAAQTSLIKQRLLCSTVLASDETSLHVGKKTVWTWVFHHADSACFVVRPSRGKAVLREFLGDVRPTVWISDRLGAQMGWASRDHQVCLAHLLRDVQYAIDAGDAVFAPGMKHLLQRAVHIGRRHPARLPRPARTVPRPAAQDRAGQQARAEAAAHHQALPPEPVRLPHRPRGLAHQQRLRTGAAALRHLPQSHQRLPIQMGRWPLADVRSALESARRRGVGILHALRLILDGQPLPTAA